jgi:inorganic pyrophosphatase
MRKDVPKLSDLEPIDEEHHTITVVIETSRGARTKLAYDPESGAFVAKKILPQGMSFPFDFGFIPSTVADDGDPLDVLLLVDEPLPPGTIVPSRLIGVIEATQTERDGTSMENHRLIAVATISELFADVKRFGDLPDAVMTQIEHFFISYNEQAGKRFEPTGRSGSRRAQTLLRDSMRRHRKR